MTKTISLSLCVLALALPMAGCSSQSAHHTASSAMADLGPKAPLDEVITTNLGKATALAGGGAELLSLTVSLTHDGMVSMTGSVGKGAVTSDFTSTNTADTDRFDTTSSVVTDSTHPATATLPMAQVDAKELAGQLTAARSSCPAGKADTRLILSAQLQHKTSEQVTCIVTTATSQETDKPVTTTLVGEAAMPLDISSIPGIQQATARAATLLGSKHPTAMQTYREPGFADLQVTGIVPGTRAMDGSACEQVSVQLVDPTRVTTGSVMSLVPVCQPLMPGDTGVTPAQLTDPAVFTSAVGETRAKLATDELRVIVSGRQLLWDFSRIVGKENKGIGSYTSTIR